MCYRYDLIAPQRMIATAAAAADQLFYSLSAQDLSFRKQKQMVILVWFSSNNSINYYNVHVCAFPIK